ncbi:MAG: hypothetical protein WBP82_02305 [Leuconostoc mesenteroides]
MALSHNDQVAEQDVANIANVKFNIGDTVTIANNAFVEKSYTLTNRRNLGGTVISKTHSI